MAFNVKTTMQLVLEENGTGTIPPMLLPFEKRLTDPAPHAHTGGGVVPPHTENFVVQLPGITTLTTFWFYPDADMDVLLGEGTTTPVRVLAGGCLGFAHGSAPAEGVLRLSYDGDEPASFTFIWGGA